MLERLLIRLPVALRRWVFRNLLRLARFLDANRRTDPGVLEVLGGHGPEPGGSLCIFAHFDRDNRIDAHVLHHVSALRDAGLQIVFVTTCGPLAQADLALLNPQCAVILRRENVGYDFGSWKAGLEYVDWARGRDALILANDSVYGPCADIKKTLHRMAGSQGDFHSLTDSDEGEHHHQSYFLYLKPKVFGDPRFRRFWERLVMHRAKLAVVQVGEIGFSRFLRQCGFVGTPLISLGDLMARYPDQAAGLIAKSPSGGINPTRGFWRQLIETHDAPFVKVDIIRDHPATAPGVSDWREILGGPNCLDTRLIEAHLERINDPAKAPSNG